MVVILWRVDVYYPVTRVHASTVHSAQRREEAVQKALQHVPYALLEEDEYPRVMSGFSSSMPIQRINTWRG